jgi:hypothetical protein
MQATSYLDSGAESNDLFVSIGHVFGLIAVAFGNRPGVLLAYGAALINFIIKSAHASPTFSLDHVFWVLDEAGYLYTS